VALLFVDIESGSWVDSDGNGSFHWRAHDSDDGEEAEGEGEDAEIGTDGSSEKDGDELTCAGEAEETVEQTEEEKRDAEFRRLAEVCIFLVASSYPAELTSDTVAPLQHLCNYFGSPNRRASQCRIRMMKKSKAKCAHRGVSHILSKLHSKMFSVGWEVLTQPPSRREHVRQRFLRCTEIRTRKQVNRLHINDLIVYAL
jgi:hypothetical protein